MKLKRGLILCIFFVFIIWMLGMTLFLMMNTMHVGQQNDSTNRLRNANSRDTSKTAEYDVTLVSQASIDRFMLFADEILLRWNGKISIALCIRDSVDAQTMKAFLNKKQYPSRLHLSYIHDGSDHYPINRLRNAAIDRVTTSHFFLTDIDVWPAADLYETLLSLPVSLQEDEKGAIIVPAYEVNYNSPQFKLVSASKGINRNKDGTCTDLESCWRKHLFVIPHHKQELLSCLQYGPCEIFKKMMLTHSSTDYARWEKAEDSKDSEDSVFDFDCFQTMGYEPYLVVKKSTSLHILIIA